MGNPFMVGEVEPLATSLRRIGIDPGKLGLGSGRPAASSSAPAGGPKFRFTEGSKAVSKLQEAADNLAIYGRRAARRTLSEGSASRTRDNSKIGSILADVSRLRSKLLNEQVYPPHGAESPRSSQGQGLGPSGFNSQGDVYHDGYNRSMNQGLRKPIGDQYTQVTSQLLDAFRHAGSLADVLAARIEDVARRGGNSLGESAINTVAHLRNMKTDIAGAIKLLGEMKHEDDVPGEKHPEGEKKPDEIKPEDEKMFKEALEAFVRDLIEATEYYMKVSGRPARSASASR